MCRPHNDGSRRAVWDGVGVGHTQQKVSLNSKNFVFLFLIRCCAILNKLFFQNVFSFHFMGDEKTGKFKGILATAGRAFAPDIPLPSPPVSASETTQAPNEQSDVGSPSKRVCITARGARQSHIEPISGQRRDLGQLRRRQMSVRRHLQTSALF